MAFYTECVLEIKKLLQIKVGKDDTIASANIGSSEENYEYANTFNKGILQSDLTSIPSGGRSVLLVIVPLLFVLSLLGNVGTLHVNYRRKIRPFFRACLFSLAVSDLLTTVTLTLTYMGQFSVEYVQIWVLGSFLCGCLPFASTAAILASSLTLVGIALDRYFAIRRHLIGFWNPEILTGVLTMLGFWGVSVIFASPLFFVFKLFPFYIITGESDDVLDVRTDTALNIEDAWQSRDHGSMTWNTGASQRNSIYRLDAEQKMSMMCLSNHRETAPYYVIMFGVIFVPCIIIFIWLNCIIARELWISGRPATDAKHRTNISKTQTTKSESHSPGETQKSILNERISSNASESATTALNIPKQSISEMVAAEGGTEQIQAVPSATCTAGDRSIMVAANNRRMRHLRMFTTVIFMMTIFIFFRLPAWLFLVLRMYGSYSQQYHWNIYFSFGVLNLASCVLNPLFYTFLAQAIQTATYIKQKVCNNSCSWRRCYKGQKHRCSCEECQIVTVLYKVDVREKQTPKPSNNEQDEGVECSDGSSEGMDYMDCSDHIYTIYPASLVSSTTASPTVFALGDQHFE